MDEQIRAGETGDKNVVIDQKLRQFFDGKIVRKDLTKKIKEGANVPVYVLEFLLGQYCSSDDEEVIESYLKQLYASQIKDEITDYIDGQEEQTHIKTPIRTDIGNNRKIVG